MRVLLTRPRAESESLAAVLAARGVDALIEPMLRIVDVPPPSLPTDMQAILFTSAQGVRAFARLAPAREVPVMAVGDATAEIARALGFAHVVSAAGDVEALAALAVARLDPAAGPLLHAAGRDVAGDLAGALAARGFRVTRAVLYAAEPAERLSPAATDALAAGALAGVLLFSPRAAAALVKVIRAAGLARQSEHLLAWCVSEAVGEAVSELAWRRVICAMRPDQASLVEAVVETMRNEKAIHP